ncbi:MAG: hypothetical protein ACI8Z1_000268 [Candidatus Azotimanducaceae bacterium]|jgi:hypothetical protein
MRFAIIIALLALPNLAFPHSSVFPATAVEQQLIAVGHTAYLMTSPNASNGNVSTLHIINTSNGSQQFYGTLYDKNGNQLGEAETLLTETSIAPYARAKVSSEALSTLFGESWSGPAMMEVFGADSFSLMIRLTSPSGLVSNTNCATEDVVHNLEGFDGTDQPFIRFINTNSAELTDITGTLYNESGAIVGSADQVIVSSLTAKQQTFITRDNLASVLGEQWDGVGSLYVSNVSGLKLILVSFIAESSTFFNFSCFEGNDDLDNPVTPPVAEPTVQNITDGIFTNRSADCANYANTYFANATDVSRSVAYQGDLTVSDEGSFCRLSTDGIPNHNFNETGSFATNVAEVQRSFNITRSAAESIASTNLTQSSYDAVMLNGVVLDLLSAGCYRPTDPSADSDGNTAIGCSDNDDWLLDPLGTEGKFGADSHNAHTQPDGTYHYHGNPNAMFDDNPGASGSPVIGFAADGFPIYGTYFLDSLTNEVRKATSGFTLKAGSRGTRDDTNPGGDFDGTYVDDYEFSNAGDLDKCNGMTNDGQFGYYVTDAYPWVLSCHRGIVDSSFDKGSVD